jgi:hypothetical protein
MNPRRFWFQNEFEKNDNPSLGADDILTEADCKSRAGVTLTDRPTADPRRR